MTSQLVGLSLLAAVMVLGAAPAEAGGGEPVGSRRESITVRVDCDQGQRITKALTRHPLAHELVIMITGKCRENVVLTRDRVTLRGSDPARDGILAESAAETIDAALWVRGAHLVTIENLSLEGGYAGLLATEASTTHLRLANCRLEGNTAYGMWLQASLVQAFDTTFEGNGNVNAGICMGSRLEGAGCVFSRPQGTGPLAPVRWNLAAVGASTVILSDALLSQSGILARDSLILLTDSALFSSPGEPSLELQQGAATLTRVEIGGQLRVRSHSNLQLRGALQTRSEATNLVSDASLVTILDAPPAAGGPSNLPSTILSFGAFDFSNVSLQQTSRLTGDLACARGSDAFCTSPTNVSGVSTCGLCQKP